MASVDLLFDRVPATGPPWDLLFGQLAGPAPSRDFDLDGAFPDLIVESVVVDIKKAYLDGAFPDLVVEGLARDIKRAFLDGAFPDLIVEVSAFYDRRVIWNLHGQAVAAHQPARSVRPASDMGWRPSVSQRNGSDLAWTQANKVLPDETVPYSTTLKLPVQSIAQWQVADHVRAEGGARHQVADLRRANAEGVHQAASPLRYVADSRMQTGINRRLPIVSPWQVAQNKRLPFFESRFKASKFRIGRQADIEPWQTARHPPNGKEVWPPVSPPALDPCYLPDPNLLFDLAWANDSGLVFICERHGPGPALVVVPIRRTYVTINSIELSRVDGNIPIPTHSFGMSLDKESWTWAWNATLPAEMRPYIAPAGNGDPAELEVKVNGIPFRLAAEGIGRDRAFAKTRINVRGRGRAAILDAPYAPVLNHGNANPRTAQQLMGDVLTINGVGIGWAIDWHLTDWLVPGGVWTHQGAYISAILDIAQAAGGYVQPHATDARLRILPRYPAAPWNWDSITPDFELPADAVSVEGIDWLQKPAYNRVHVSGTSQGVLGEITRAGTGGGLVAPMVTDALITHADAARQRGLAVLSDTGSQAHVTLKLPVLAETGIIVPGKFVRYVDGADTRFGLVRSTAVEWSRPVLRQTITVETHEF